MDMIKEAFSKIKEDIHTIQAEILTLKDELNNLKNQTHIPTTPTHIQSKDIQQTDKQTHTTSIPTHNYPLKAPYPQNLDISIGNGGVPTDKQTNRQTDKQTQKHPNFQTKQHSSEFRQAEEILTSLDALKKEIRLKFKRLTPQEMLIFTTLYSFEEQKIDEITYRTLANNLQLSESSIRDYINKLIKKGIPIDKIRQNNKTIVLKVSKNLKNIATLSTIIHLRDL